MTWAGKRVLITGATGFVGGRLATRLVDEGAQVTALVRDPARAAHLAHVERVHGDLAARDAMAWACRGRDVVIHCAARASDSGSPGAYYRDNVAGTLELARAAADGGVGRFVFLSTISVYGFTPPAVADETTPLEVGDLGGAYPYGESKLVAERALEAMRGVDTVIARVGSVYGPGSSQWTARPVRLMRTPVIGMMQVDGGRGLHNYVYIDNLIDGLLACACHPDAPGSTFNLTDGVASYAAFFGIYAQMVAQMVRTGPPPMRDLSMAQALAVAGVAERIAALRGKTPLITRIAVRLLCRQARFPSSRAREVLGWVSRVSLDDGMAACERWLGDQGLLG